MGITAIIPCANRATIEVAVDSLLQTGSIERVIVPTTADQYSPIARRIGDRAQVLASQEIAFDKSKLLNLGLEASSSEKILCSDADIIWTGKAIDELTASCICGAFGFCYILQVVETDPAQSRGAHIRLAWSLAQEGSATILRLNERQSMKELRPGYGLVFGSRQSFYSVGGFKDHWGGGWGWEDVDFLVRAKILGASLNSAGCVQHQTHGDELRAISGTSKAESRNHNVRLSLQDIRAGKISGPLARPTNNIQAKVVKLECASALANYLGIEP